HAPGAEGNLLAGRREDRREVVDRLGPKSLHRVEDLGLLRDVALHPVDACRQGRHRLREVETCRLVALLLEERDQVRAHLAGGAISRRAACDRGRRAILAAPSRGPLPSCRPSPRRPPPPPRPLRPRRSGSSRSFARPAASTSGTTSAPSATWRPSPSAPTARA